ncbi:hypothetical protein HNP38_002215 [Chryseobacterium defluvii]|uniref:DUF1835 domain-containing protein n=1 Tax=Chryseobacterium defluvii TaxID=160396 RepID=A0A840KBV0_9FLAO|nr:DUF1835 domain-containing protein [Chryseobacterium defluvii]MBB4806919.1 hypothetical protein [Chryseobacterium defluvii]
MNPVFHILNGDCLAEQLKETSVGGEVIICREALVSGKVKADSLEDFWELRAEFISGEYGIEKETYYEKTVSEFQKIINIPEFSEVNLWFEDDLFCQINLWFCVFLLSKIKNIRMYLVFPLVSENEDHWRGFSLSDSKGLEESMQSRIEFREKDIQLGVNLWNTYQNDDRQQLIRLSENESDCFALLKPVIEAYCNTSPENITLTNPEVYIKNLVDNGIRDFSSVFKTFQQNLGIYGYGDLQVKKMYDKALQS